VGLSSLLCPVKNQLGLRTPGVYRVYIGQMGCSMDIRLKEHQLHIQAKSAVAEHSIHQGHHIHFHSSSTDAKKTRYMDSIIREAFETELHSYNINTEGGFCLSKS
jgi:hypothetical protein